MHQLYTWTTPNGRKAAIMLEEIGAAYEVHPVDLQKNEQFAPEFLKISPNNKIPALIDAHGHPLFESGAILLHLAESSGKLLSPDPARRVATLEWLFWASASLGPICGQYMFFAVRSEQKVPAAVERFGKEAVRLFGVMEKRLSQASYLAEEYSIADIAAYPWIAALLPELKKGANAALPPTPSIERWLKAIGERPAVVKGMAVPKV